MRGKYSPTVSGWYSRDQQWWNKNCIQSDIYQEFDKDGYDSYGYNSKGIDREGIHENGYALDEAQAIFEDVWDEWYNKPAPKLINTP